MSQQPVFGRDIRVGDEVHLRRGRTVAVTAVELPWHGANYSRLFSRDATGKERCDTVMQGLTYSVTRTQRFPHPPPLEGEGPCKGVSTWPLGIVRESTMDEISLAETVAKLVAPHIGEEGSERFTEPELSGYLMGIFELVEKLMYPDRPRSVGSNRLLFIMDRYLDDGGRYIGPLPRRDDNDILRVDGGVSNT